MIRVAEPDHVIVHRLADYLRCRAKLETESTKRHEKRQVFDIPPARIRVTEHQAEVRQCAGCGVSEKGGFPAAMSQPTHC